jgi:hypothetical protein
VTRHLAINSLPDGYECTLSAQVCLCFSGGSVLCPYKGWQRLPPPAWQMNTSIQHSYCAAPAAAGAQNRSNARVRSAAIAEGSRPSMFVLSNMKATLPSRINVIDGEDGANPVK